uniref:DNA topoisomerase n=1 Tax=Schistocephalus solidus TaxID=70667 RepID=A0A0X3PKL9_SCHSO
MGFPHFGFVFIKRAFASMRILNVAEKNEAAKNIAAILSQGRATRREGFSKFNKIYEFPCQMNGQTYHFVMTSVSGHLLNYDFTQRFRSWQSCDPSVLFEAPVEKKCSPDFEPIKRTLQREARNCTKLIIWTDCDREGENIGMEIVSVCQEVKPSILVSRARFSEITPHAIHQAINTLTVMDENMSLAVDTRQELDLRIGAAFTRFQTLRLRRAFPRALAEQLISYGSCQFPTLGFVVERFREVENFVPEPFWKIVAHFDRQNTQTSFTWKRGRLFDRDCCSAYHQHLLENPFGQVIDVQQRPKSKWRPLPMDTVEMEKLAARKLHIGAKQTMQLAESLYTRGFISYPRTETNMFPAELDLVPLVQAQTEDSRWSAFAHNLLTNGLRPRAGKKSDKAHPPIHPLKCGSALQVSPEKC